MGRVNAEIRARRIARLNRPEARTALSPELLELASAATPTRSCARL
jgi:hypothetical protein